jgi:hypothetical protein
MVTFSDYIYISCNIKGENMKRYNMVKSKIKGHSFDARLAKTVDAWVDVKNTKSREWRARAVKAGRSR